MSIRGGANAFMIAVHEASTFQMQGTLWRVLATGRETNGLVGAMDERVAHGLAAPMHVHEREDEIFYVVDGEITFYADDHPIEAAAGTFVYLPRYIKHGFRVESKEARVFNFVTPAGFEATVTDHGESAKYDDIAKPVAESSNAPSPDMVRMFREKYGMIIDVGDKPPHAH